MDINILILKLTIQTIILEYKCSQNALKMLLKMLSEYAQNAIW